MKKKIEITEKQRNQFNQMLHALKTIKAYQTVNQLRKDSGKDWGLEFEEALEYAYENVKTTAFIAGKNVKPI